MVHAATLSTSAPVPLYALVTKKTSGKKNNAIKIVKNQRKAPPVKPTAGDLHPTVQ